MKKKLLTIAGFISCLSMNAQTVSKVWVADNGNGTYKNPILHIDYSDPDVCKAGDAYYMTASSFNNAPGLPILKSTDLVNWELIGYALNKQIPVEHFQKVQHGQGVWAPSIRYYKNEFYIYYPDPDFGIYMIKAKNAAGPWSDPVLVDAGKGLIDPCPLWDDDGRVYLTYAFAGSRAGIKSVLAVKELNAAGTKVINDGSIVYDGHEKDKTVEGPKFYKHNGFYYIFAPAGGETEGWQIVLRSKNVYGPYERKVVMHQGKSPTNGPHQGGWVRTNSGEDWFFHFQDKDAYGRIVHLQPMTWKDNWPVIGIDADGDGIGDPVIVHKKPTGVKAGKIMTPPDSDEFSNGFGLQWQWQANPRPFWSFARQDSGYLRLYHLSVEDSLANSFDIPNMLTQKIPAETFTATIKLKFRPNLVSEKFGFGIFGLDYAYIGLYKKPDGKVQIGYYTCKKADKGGIENEQIIEPLTGEDFYIRVKVDKGGICTFSYCTDGKSFDAMPVSFTAKPGKWVGAKLGMFGTAFVNKNDAGFTDVDWVRFEPIQ